MQNSCCATVLTIATNPNTNAKTTTATNFYCLPIDLVSGMPNAVINSTLSYTYTCNSPVTPASDNCTSGSTPCATLLNACCITRNLKINGNDVRNTQGVC